MVEKSTRIAIVSTDRCKPKKCRQECRKACPVVKTGKYDDPPDWEVILRHFRGSELQNYFTKVLEDDIKAIIKPQYVDNIPRALAKSPVKDVGGILKKLKGLLKREVAQLSGGELQRFALAMTCVQAANMLNKD
ncbi:hypothetical protein QCA50_009846 [Cerrena zonata]|uniref:RNase L inhibitor RLI-like possible metal-binding domain-containing protein n=1 Tax=Cerrena zonata TaxID=2478898 RepID=A0AAW0FZY9_9APHY